MNATKISKELDRLEKGLGIDRDDLAGEFGEFPTYVYEVGVLAAYARQLVDEAKSASKSAEATHAAQARQELVEAGGKVTEAAVSAHIDATRPEGLGEDLRAAETLYRRVEALRDAVTQRSYMLKLLGETSISELRAYGSSDGIPSDVEDVREKLNARRRPITKRS